MPAYKDEKRGTWYAAFYYVDWQGKRRHKVKRGFARKGDARDYEMEFLNSKSHGPEITFGNMVEEYLKDMEPRIKPSSMATKRAQIDAHILPYFKDMNVADIDVIAIHSWQNQLLSRRTPSGDNYSPAYLKNLSAQMSAVMNYAVSHYNLDKNPCAIAGSIGKIRTKEMEFWTKEEFDRFLEKCKKPAYRLAFEILFYTGVREGEMLALTPEDIKEDLRIDINKTYAYIDGQELFLTPKTDKSKRCISIPQFLYDDIMDYLDQIYIESPEERIFYFKKHSLLKEFHKATEDAGLKQIRIHDLRHSHASMLINMGVDIKEISDRLGHESVKTTWDIYSHIYPDQDRKLANKIQELKDGPQDKEKIEPEA